MEVVALAAMDLDGWIGVQGKLPWHLPDDLKHFKELTRGKPVIMGRKTWESIGAKPLPQRTNIVLSRSATFAAPGALRAQSVEAALAAAEGAQVCIIGGAEVYALFLPHTTRLELTIVNTHVRGDTRFPQVDWTQWQRESVIEHAADARHSTAFRFETWRLR
ncbi:MAG: dihydrofolate reductase [Planctomycetes bacterium]|nr:dihydrofolate reductase [Planctomycetota bacterium]